MGKMKSILTIKKLAIKIDENLAEIKVTACEFECWFAQLVALSLHFATFLPTGEGCDLEISTRR